MAGLLYSCCCPLCAGKTLSGDGLSAGSSSLAAPPPEPIVTYSYTGDYRIDTLLLGVDTQTGVQALQYRWNNASPLGQTPLAVTYSFMSAKPIYGGTDDGQGDTGFSQFNLAEKAAVRQIMSMLQTTLGITIREVDDTTFNYGQIRLGNNSQEFSAGYTWLPFSTGDDKGGDVWIDQKVAASSMAVGSFGWATLVHEIGHAMGLKHPGNYNAGSPVSPELGNWLGEVEDNANYTIMSYRSAAGGQDRDWFGMYDLLTLKALYGSGTPNAGDTVHRYDNSVGRVLGIVDDAGGFDTLDLSAVSAPATTVDLRAGAFSSVGFNGFTTPAVNNLSISLTSVIEKYVGTPFSDTVTGNGAANQLFLGGGTNAANGGGGVDMALYASPRSAYQVSINGPSVHVSGGGVNDSLADIERLAFADRKLAVDVGGSAAIAAKVLGAVFDGSAIAARPDYMGIGLSLLDSGMSYEALMLLALNARHVGPGTSHAALVELLYTNVVGFAPDAQQLAFYTAWLDNGTYTEAQLGVFAAQTPQNLVNIDWAGLSVHGIDYL